MDDLHNDPELYHPALQRRLDTLSRLVAEHPREVANGGINTHVHTNESFSIFKSPTEAVWQAYKEDVAYFGINDHYSTGGHAEFGSACDIAGIKALFNIEAKAMDAEAARNGRRVNDPSNPGRVYLTGKGVTRDLQPGSEQLKTLERMKEGIRERNETIVGKLNAYAAAKGYPVDLSYADARALTPRGNVTERHVAQAFCERLDALAGSPDERKSIYDTLLDADLDDATLEDDWDVQDIVRTKLLRSGMPCYVQEGGKGFTSVAGLVNIFLGLGAIPTYNYMASPLTKWEADVEWCVEKAKAWRLFTLDIFEFRGAADERMAEILRIAAEQGLPAFIGTESNIKRKLPLSGDIAMKPEHYGYLRDSADLVLGHQLLSSLCDFGYVTADGRPRFGDLKAGFRFFASVGASAPGKETVAELKCMDLQERRKFFGI